MSKSISVPHAGGSADFLDTKKNEKPYVNKPREKRWLPVWKYYMSACVRPVA